MQCQSPAQRSDDAPRYPLQIVNFRLLPNRPSQLTLNTQNLKEILTLVGGRPIYLLSIAGASRQGKSFLMTILLHMLENLSEYETDRWDDILCMETLKGFKFQTGTERQTVGFWMWSKPFIFKHNDNEIAVLVMDTQGVFDSYTTKRDWSMIVGLALLTSSCFIYNLFTNLQEDSLEIFNNFLEFGLLSLGHDEAATSVFQKLLFLIRDWGFPQTYPYGSSGGSRFLEDKLQIKPNMPEELQKVRKSITTCFEKTECFLMPNPGEAAKENIFQGNLHKLDATFLRNLKAFATNLLQVDQMQPLTIGGEVIKGMGLMNYMEKYIAAFNRQNIPKAMSLFEATQEAHLEALVCSCKQFVADNITKIITQFNFLPVEDLRSRVDSICKSAAERYILNAKCRNDTMVNKHRRRLTDELRRFQKSVEEQNESRKNEFLDSKLQHVIALYKSDLELKLNSKTYLPPQLEDLFNESQQKALMEFGAVCGKKSPKFFKDGTAVLNTELQTLQDSFVAVNSKNLSKVDETSQSVIMRLVNEYIQQMQLFVNSKPNENMLVQQHQQIEAMLVAKFDNETKYDNNCISDFYLTKLKAQILGPFREFAKSIKINQDEALNKAIAIYNAAIQTYTDYMQLQISVQQTSKASLDQDHKFQMINAKSNLFPIYHFCPDQAENYRIQLEMEIESIYSKMTKQLEDEKIEFQENWEKEILEINKDYCQRMHIITQPDSSLSEQEFRNAHNQLQVGIEQHTQTIVWLPENRRREFISALSVKIQHSFSEFLKTFQINIEQKELHMTLNMELGVKKYVKELKKTLGRTSCFNLTQLDAFIHQLKTNAIQEFVDACTSLPKANVDRLSNVYHHKLEQDMDIVRTDYQVKLDNKKNEIARIVEDCCDSYANEMSIRLKLIRSPDDLDLQSIHDLCKAMTTRQLKNMLLSFETILDVSESREQFFTRIAKEFDRLKQETATKQQAFQEQIVALKSGIIRSFKHKLDDMVQVITHESELHLGYETQVRQISNEFEMNFPPHQMQFYLQEKKSLLEELQNAYQKVRMQYRENLDHCDLASKDAIISIRTDYKAKMDSILGTYIFLKEEDIMQHHKQALNEGLEMINHLAQSSSINCKQYEKTLSDTLQQCLDQYSMENVSKRESFELQLMRKIDELKNRFISELVHSEKTEEQIESTKKEYLRNCTIDIHEQYRLPSEEIVKTFLEPKLTLALQEAYREWKSSEPAKIEVELAIINAKLVYHEHMEDKTHADVHMHPDELKDIHKKAIRFVEEQFANKIKQTKKVKNRFISALNEAYRKYEDKNLLRAAELVDVSIGIDLGTTFSCVSVYRNGKVEMIPDHNNHRNGTPSYIQFKTADEVYVGEVAKNQACMYPDTTIFDAKRLIGRWFSDTSVQNDIKTWPFKVINQNNRPQIQVHGKNFMPQEISAKVLKKLKTDAETHLKRTVTNAVITVPAYFNDAQKQATKHAGVAAGLNVLGLLNEPTAAAIAYSLNYADEDKRNLFVYDLGGGTFDISVLEVKGGKISVKAVDGDTHLGGSDFDNEMLKYCIAEFERINNVRLDPTDFSHNSRIQRTRHACEKEKINLSILKQTFVTVDRMFEDKNMHIEVTREIFNRLNQSYFKKTIQIAEKALILAKLKKEDIHDVVLVGGSTRIPQVQELLKAFFNDKPLNMALNPDEVVANGAAIYAALKTGSKAKELGHIEFSDVTPLSIGILLKGGGFSPIINKNTTVPVSETKQYYTTYHNQTSVNIEVYEGEDEVAVNNNFLGKFMLNGIPPASAGKEKIDVTVTCNEEGILTVTAVCKTNGKEQIIKIEADRFGLSA